MSKIKSKRLEPRTTNGTLTIGNEEGPSTTQFEGTVIIPNYATVDYVDQIVAGDLSIELGSYQKRDEKNRDAGYAGLDDTGRVPADRIDTDVLVAELNEHHDEIDTNTAKIAQLESATAFQIEYYMGNLTGVDPAINYMSINAATWADTTQIKINTTDAGGAIHDFSAIKQGDTIWFADVTPDSVVAADVDTTGLFTVDSNTAGAGFTTFVVTMQSASGGPMVGDRIEAQIFPAFDVSSKADIVYVDAQDKWIKDNYLDLSGLNNMKAGTKINWNTGDPGGQLSYGGSTKITLGSAAVKFAKDIDMSSKDVTNVNGVKLTGDRTIDVETGIAGMLQYNGGDRFKWGSAFIWSYVTLDMQDNKIIHVPLPVNPKDVATKEYVDSQSSGPTPIEVGTSVSPPTRPKGSLYLTTGGNIYAYT